MRVYQRRNKTIDVDKIITNHLGDFVNNYLKRYVPCKKFQRWILLRDVFVTIAFHASRLTPFKKHSPRSYPPVN